MNERLERPESYESNIIYNTHKAWYKRDMVTEKDYQAKVKEAYQRRKAVLDAGAAKDANDDDMAWVSAMPEKFLKKYPAPEPPKEAQDKKKKPEAKK